MVRKERLELSRVTPLEPKSSASTSSATLAIRRDLPEKNLKKPDAAAPLLVTSIQDNPPPRNRNRATIRPLTAEAKGNGIDGLLDAFHNQNGEMRGRVSVYKSIVTIITLSSGGSAGKEGPSAQIGASIGSKINNLFGGGARARRTLLLAGAAASLGTIFQAPLGGAITAIEMVYKEDIESDALIPAIISSVSAYFLLSFFGLVHRDLFTLRELEPKYLTLYPLLGVICFFVGLTLVKFIQRVKSFFLNWNIYPPFKPAIGGLI